MNYFDHQTDVYPTEMLETYSKATQQSIAPTNAPETIPLEKAAQILTAVVLLKKYGMYSRKVSGI